MKIPFVDLRLQYHNIKQEVDAAMSSVMEDTAFIGGKYVKEFERAFAEKYDVNYCLGVANGTDAIYITLKTLGIGQGDEVITVANSWISTSETISQTGATPIFVDINPETYTIDVDKISEKITSKTKAIIPVHLYGQAAEVSKIKKIADDNGISIIEDCAQSHFSEENKKRVGTTGIAGTFSFYPGKNLGAYGDAGCIISNDSEFITNARMYANHGALKKHEHKIEGLNSRLDGLQAAVLSVKLNHILNWTDSRIKNAALYTEMLKGVEQIETPLIRKNTKHTFHLYVIRTTERDSLKQYLEEQGIQTAIHYPTALPNLKAYEYLGLKPNDYAVASKYQNEILSLPLYPELEKDQIVYICQSIKSFFK